MRSPWLDVPLADYEGHMAHVGQAALLDRLFAEALAAVQPQSLAVLGAAGGNGFERLVGGSPARTVAVDINCRYLAELERRYKEKITGLEIVCADICDESLDFPPVDYVHAALVLEYVDATAALRQVRRWLSPGGSLGIVLQLPGIASVSPSPFTRLAPLGEAMRLYEEDEFRAIAGAAGFAQTAREVIVMPAGKRFAALRFAFGQVRQNR